MALSEIKVSLRLTGDNLVPSEISSALGCNPSEARAKGEEIESQRFIRKSPTGVWILRSHRKDTLDEAIQDLLERVNVDATVWNDLTNRFRAEFFVGLFSDTNQAGLTISAMTLRRLSDLRLAIALDVYCSSAAAT